MNENMDDVSARLRRSLTARGAAPQLDTEIVSGAALRRAPRLTSSPRRRLQLAGGVTAAVAAITVGALLITTPLQPQPLFTAAGGPANPSALGASDESATSDLRIANWVTYEYTAGDALSSSGGTGTVYQLTRPGSAESRAATVAAALGVEGSPAASQYSDPAYPTYVVGPEDGTAPNVTVSWSGTGNWWYSNPAAYPVVECTSAPATEGDESLIDPACGAPETPAAASLAPSESEARALARAMFAATGLTVAERDVRVTADAWQTTATANLVVDGIATALDWGISWAPSGEISWAYGQSVELVDRGSYGTVSERDAVARIADGRWFGAAGPDFQGGMSLLAADAGRSAADSSVSSEPSSEPTDPQGETPSSEPTAEPQPGTEPVPAPETVPGSEPTVEPAPLPEQPLEPEVVEVTVTSATPTLLLLWDTEGNAWLVPGFAMPHPDGWWNTIISLVDGVIALPVPAQVEPYSTDGPIAY
jgi:hypothetical protein